MCFSATASFVAGTALFGAGVLALRLARSPAERPFAAIPLLFAIQQITEGFVWLSFGWSLPGLNAALTQIYSFFSHVLWPVYVPIATWLIEPQRGRRLQLASLAAGGSVVGLFLLYSMFNFPIKAQLAGGHIDYVSPHFYLPVVMILYLAATTGSMLLTSHRMVRLFGALALVASAVTYLTYARWFISVWCFSAAVLSVIVCLHMGGRRNHGAAAPA